ncbi:MAG: hypothetical protein A2Y79_09195 [Deltaproteobacteria bacterium RBG_13_43_22]|nr:MAG: hypothetical protein A2Y79_09195 [Deltaproteobacteria bacterium RBG_13_43_22]
MFENLINFYQQIILQKNPLVPAIVSVSIILSIGVMAWWVFNLVFRFFKKRYKDTPYFVKNNRVFNMLRKAGHYSILLLVGVGLINLLKVSNMEKIFSAFMIVLFALFFNTIARDLIII